MAFLHARPQRFDLVTGLDIVEHFTKDEVLDFLDACREALRPGGRLVLQTPNGESPFGGAVRYGDFTTVTRSHTDARREERHAQQRESGGTRG